MLFVDAASLSLAKTVATENVTGQGWGGRTWMRDECWAGLRLEIKVMGSGDTCAVVARCVIFSCGSGQGKAGEETRALLPLICAPSCLADPA